MVYLIRHMSTNTYAGVRPSMRHALPKTTVLGFRRLEDAEAIQPYLYLLPLVRSDPASFVSSTVHTLTLPSSACFDPSALTLNPPLRPSYRGADVAFDAMYDEDAATYFCVNGVDLAWIDHVTVSTDVCSMHLIDAYKEAQCEVIQKGRMQARMVQASYLDTLMERETA
jgi:hypothetical protein